MIRKEINFLGKAIILGVICFSATYFARSPERVRVSSTPQINYENIEEIQRKVLDEKLSALSQSSSPRLVDELKRKVTQQNIELERYKREIASLKVSETISEASSIPKDELIKPIFQEEIIPYNSANSSILYKAHKIELKRLTDKLSLQEDQFLKTHDMSNSSNQELLRDLKDNHELQIHALKSRYHEKRRKFKTNKYLVNNAF